MENFLRVFLVVLVVGLLAGNSFAADLFFDEDFKHFQDEHQIKNQKCTKLKTIGKRMDCEDAAMEAWKVDVRRRGGEAYFNKHYVVLDFDALESRLDELKILSKKAPKFRITEGQKPGVLYDAIFRAEIQMVEQLQAERYRVTYCEGQKKHLEEINFTMERLPEVCKQYFKEKEVEERLKKKGLK
jgi:hypothetical protein